MNFQLFAQLYVAAAMFAFVALLLDAVSAPGKPQDGRLGFLANTLPATFAVGIVALALAALWPIVLVRLAWTVMFPAKPVSEKPLDFKRGPGARR